MKDSIWRWKGSELLDMCWLTQSGDRHQPLDDYHERPGWQRHARPVCCWPTVPASVLKSTGAAFSVLGFFCWILFNWCLNISYWETFIFLVLSMRLDHLSIRLTVFGHLSIWYSAFICSTLGHLSMYCSVSDLYCLFWFIFTIQLRKLAFGCCYKVLF